MMETEQYKVDKSISIHFKFFITSFYYTYHIDIVWAQHFDQCEKYLMAIHPSCSFVVWDVTTGTKLWKKIYTEQILSIDLDPFDSSRIACNSLANTFSC